MSARSGAPSTRNERPQTDFFIADIDRQYESYLIKAGIAVADRYLDAIQATSALLGRHPYLGPPGGFAHPRLRHWRYFLVPRPFNQHILLYEVSDDEVVLRRTMDGQRDLPGRLIDPPGAP